MASPSQPVHPLRIEKGVPSPSPTKFGSSLPRPLSELAPTEKRRNSPSYHQASKKMVLNVDSSPFQSSPFNPSEVNSSPRLFWQGRDPATPKLNSENKLFAGREGSPSPTRRTSIEKLQKASRVKNSNMFAREQKQEYDPTSVPVIERPLAKVQSPYGVSGLENLRSQERGRLYGHHRNESKVDIPLYSPTKTPLQTIPNGLYSPSKDQISPTKSSLSSRNWNGKASYDSENGMFSDDMSADDRQLPPGRVLHRHAKSVTFDAAPPQVNEYEMATPDLSSVGTGSRENSYDSGEEEEDSYNLGDSMDQDDSFDASLEDTEKTPVVGPEDWRRASPGSHNGLLSGHYEDPFQGPEGSPMPDARPTSSHGRPAGVRTDSLNSNGEHRPLPPLPGLNGRKNSGSSVGLSAAAERASTSQRNLPSPPQPASISKADIHGLAAGKMTLEERLRLMMIQDDDKPKSTAELQRERRMRRANGRSSQTPERDISINIHEDEDTLDELPGLDSFQLPGKISRESILRKVNGQEAFSRESDYNFDSPAPSSSPARPAAIDPDTPLPSTEAPSMIENDDADESVIIKPEPEEDDEVDVYAIPEMYQQPESKQEDYDIERESMVDDNDTASQYSNPAQDDESPKTHSNSATEDEGPPTPRQIEVPASIESTDPVKKDERNSLPEFTGFLTQNDFGLSMQSYMTPSPPLPAEEEKTLEETQSPYKGSRMSDAHEYLSRPETPERKLPNSRPEYDGTGWGSDDEDDIDSGTPESVIRHPMPPSPSRDSPSIPEQIATIKSSGSKLKTRPSATPSDLMAMREARRIISGETPNIPPIPERHRNRPSLNMERETSETVNIAGDLERASSFKKKSLTLDIGSDLGLGLDKDFDRVIEAQKVAFSLSSSHFNFLSNDDGQGSICCATIASEFNANVNVRRQRGYLMRQNTKVVVATSTPEKGDEFHSTRSAGNSPVKKERPQSWTVEPWNGQMRKSSVRDRANPRKRPATGAVPPMPGQESNASGLGKVAEEALENPGDDGGERGRLFVKVIGVKDLDLPLPRSEQSWFSLTLDNGVHCVTTAWLELGRNAPIGQEFELVVPNELEFQLTLNAKLVKPAPKRVTDSPTKGPKIQKQSAFSRVFASPRKRKELEQRQKEEEHRFQEHREREAAAKRASQQPTAWDLLSPLAAEDGTFGRSYICLKDHEKRCYGRPYVVDVACFNEWATEQASHTSSVISKRGNTTVHRRAPYKVGKLELQLLFVPKPRGATDDDMPKSMNSCIREMKEAEQASTRTWEGYLSQEGGDCPYWRRRYFKLVGSKLTAFHESTKQPRATINLANASKLIDDRRSLTQKETTGRGGKRRKSGFAEEEEGYMFVEEGFRIRFNNGEVIDFYADTRADKDGWMKMLDNCVGKESGSGSKSGWCDLVLKHEDQLKKKSEQQQGVRKTSNNKHHNRTKSVA